MVELGGEYVEIEIEYCILWWDESSIFIELELILDADHIAYES